MPRRMWETVEAKVGETGIAEAKRRKKKKKSKKEEDNRNKESSRGVGNMG